MERKHGSRSGRLYPPDLVTSPRPASCYPRRGGYAGNRERERERARADKPGEQQAPCRAGGSPTGYLQGSIPGPRDHDQSQGRRFTDWAIQTSQDACFTDGKTQAMAITMGKCLSWDGIQLPLVWPGSLSSQMWERPLVSRLSDANQTIRPSLPLPDRQKQKC